MHASSLLFAVAVILVTLSGRGALAQPVPSDPVLDLCAGNLDTIAGARAFLTTAFNVNCVVDTDCITPAAQAQYPPGINLGDPCVIPHCVNTQIIVVNAHAAFVMQCGEPFVGVLNTTSFCVYGYEVDEYYSVLGLQLAALVADVGLATAEATDQRLAAGYALWIPELYQKIQCPTGLLNPNATLQCVRGMCGALSANPARGITAQPYGCNVMIDDPLLSRYGHNIFGTIEPVFFPTRFVHYGDLVLTFEGVSMPFNYHGSAYTRNRTLQYGVMTANKYGMDPTEGCGSVVDYCIWSDPRGLFEPQNVPCVLGGNGDGADFSCNLARCGGSGRCGVAINVGLPCPISSVYFGSDYEASTDIGGNAGRALISPDCISSVPVCIQRSTTDQGLPPFIIPLLDRSMDWVTAALGDASTFAATTTIANWPPVFVSGAPLELTTGTIAYTTLVQANATLGQDLLPGLAPAVCAFSNPNDIMLGAIQCVLSPLDRSTFLLEMNLGCVRTDLGGVPIGQCSGNFATPFTDGDGAVVVLGYPTTPTVIQIAICRPATTGFLETVCTPDVPLGVILTNTSANVSCLVATCDGAGMCGWYAREAGSPCIPLEEQAANPCVVWTCDKGGHCLSRKVQLGENVTCAVGIPCQTAGRCAAGVCQLGIPVPGCVPCTVDGECQCTGVGTVVGWCNAALGVCSQSALLPPEAIDLDDPAVWLPLQPEERDDSDWWDPRFVGGSCTTSRGHRFCEPSPRGPSTCLMGRGMCGVNGTCGPPVPLCRFVRPAANETGPPPPPPNSTNITTNTTGNNSSSGIPPCNLTSCTLEPAFANWFAPLGELCMQNTECRSGSGCLPWSLGPSNVTNCTCGDGRGGGGATRCRSPGFTPQGQPCSQQTIPPNQPGRPDLCARSWQCDGAGECVVLTRQACPSFPLTDAVASAGLDFGTCVAPATCNADTGACPLDKLVEPLPYGTLCAVACSNPPTFGTCDGAGTCRAAIQPCTELNPCLSANCFARARLDQPNSSWTATDVGVDDVGHCVSQPIEQLITTGGSIGCSTADNPCIIGQLCNGGGVCTGGQNVSCSLPSACSVTTGCSVVTGTCTFTQLAAGSFCNPTSSAGGGVCTANTTCQSTGSCVGAQVTCPVLPNVTSATINSACTGFHATCEGILDLITGTLPDMPSMTGVVSVIIPSGNLVLLADTTAGAEQLLLNITGSGNTTQYAGLLMDFSGLVVSRAAASSISGVCVYFVASSGSPCTLPDVCVMSAACTAAGLCLPTRLVSCPNGPGNNCLSPNGTCVPFVGCTYTVLQSGESCNDQNLCTQNDVCHSGGICSGTPVGCSAPPAQGCQIYPPGQTCATGCTLVNVTDGTNCSCSPRPGGGPVICTGVCMDGFCATATFPCVPPCPTNTTPSGAPRYQCVTPGVCTCTPGLTSINCSTITEQGSFIICASSSTATALGLTGLLFLLLTIGLGVCLCSCLLCICVEFCASRSARSAIVSEQ